jgi:hypothetical protein
MKILWMLKPFPDQELQEMYKMTTSKAKGTICAATDSHYTTMPLKQKVAFSCLEG